MQHWIEPMDEMKIKTLWLRGLIKRIVNKTLKKKYGIDLNLDIRELEVISNLQDQTVTLSTSIDISIPTSDINKIISQPETMLIASVIISQLIIYNTTKLGKRLCAEWIGLLLKAVAILQPLAPEPLVDYFSRE